METRNFPQPDKGLQQIIDHGSQTHKNVPLSELDKHRLVRKQDLVKVRQTYPGYSMRYAHSDKSYEKESDWLDNDSTFISRGLPTLFGSREMTPDTRIPYEGRRQWEDYDFENFIVKYFDNLVKTKNPDEKVSRADLEKDWVLDMGCGRGVALEDIWAYYGPVLNLYLKGNTGHLPNYAPKFLKRGIELIGGSLTDQGVLTQRPPNGYSLIMANQVLHYYEDALPFVEFGFKNLTPDGVFPLSYGAVFGDNIAILDTKGKLLSRPNDYLDERIRKLGWTREGDLLVVRANPTKKIGLSFVKDEGSYKRGISLSWDRPARDEYMERKVFQITE